MSTETIRELDTARITDAVERLCIQANTTLPDDVRAALEGDEHVALAGVDDLHVGTVVLHEAPEGEGYVEVDGLLLRVAAERARVVSAVPCVDDEGEVVFAVLRQHGECAEEERENDENDAFELHWFGLWV